MWSHNGCTAKCVNNGKSTKLSWSTHYDHSTCFSSKLHVSKLEKESRRVVSWHVQRGGTLTHSYDTDQVTKQIHTCHGCLSNLCTELCLGQLRQFNQQCVNEQEIRGKVISCHTRTHDSRKCSVGNSVFNYTALTKASGCRGIMFSFSSDCDQC